MYGDEFFRRAPLCQFKPGDGSHHQIVFIDSLASAKSAMKLIVDQGEGSGGADGHYQIFKGLVSSGVPHHNVVDDPKTEAFKDKPFYKVKTAVSKMPSHSNKQSRRCLPVTLRTAISFRRLKYCGRTTEVSATSLSTTTSETSCM